MLTRDCIDRFPDGLATGDAGWTTGGNLPVQWVIHAVGPNYGAGQTDSEVLASCYRRALEVADELGARSIAFPLISSGIYAWPLEDAVRIAVRTLFETPAKAEEIRIVSFSEGMHELVERELLDGVPMRILAAVRELHQRGYLRVRALPGVSPSGMYWRVTITAEGGDPLRFTTGDRTEFVGGAEIAGRTVSGIADVILESFPGLRADQGDPAYAVWFAGLVDQAEQADELPIAYADYFDDSNGWEIGWGTGVRYPAPPASLQ